MCDTLIASAEATRDGVSLFAKNSDRPPNEAQYMDWVPAKVHEPGDQVQCTYISIPQARETRAVLLSRPFWMWGAEMGINASGLAIGNEAVFSKVQANKEPALLGMDLLRLALERADTPVEAVEVIVELLETYGQGGNCQHKGKMYYHNSFLIANHDEAWVLETIDKEWAARKVGGVYSISNVFTLGGEWDRASAGLAAEGEKPGFDLDKDKSDLIYTTFGGGRARCGMTRAQLGGQEGAVTIESMLGILRSHGDVPDPKTGLFGSQVCMHAGFGPVRVSQSTASMLTVLEEGGGLVLATGTSAPCTGIFKPMWTDIPAPVMGPQPTDQFDVDTLYWSHERLHRAVLRNYPGRMAVYTAARDQLEAEFVSGALARMSAPAEERAAYSEECFRRAAEAEEEWLEAVMAVPAVSSGWGMVHNTAWNGFNRESGLALE